MRIAIPKKQSKIKTAFEGMMNDKPALVDISGMFGEEAKSK